MLLKLETEASLKNIEEQESMSPSLPITTSASTVPVYQSKTPLSANSSDPFLTDFGQMRHAEAPGNQEWCMPDLYRAPEVLLELPFSFPVDVWSIGVMVSAEAHWKYTTRLTCPDSRTLGRQKSLRPY